MDEMRTSSGRFEKKHGLTKSGEKVPSEYLAWQRMKDRCLNANCPDYANYGGRGIKIAPEWVDDPAAFIAYVGPRPTPNHSIDRKENDGDYVPGNVRWATRAEQNRNRRSSKLDAMDIQFIRHWVDVGYMQTEIAMAFDVTQSHISRINSGSCWGTATGGV